MAKFKRGDKVRLADTEGTQQAHQRYPEYCPEPGTIGTVYDKPDRDGTTLVEWPQGSLPGPRLVYWTQTKWLERVEGAEPVESTSPNYSIRIMATSNDDAQVAFYGPTEWVHEALAQAIMTLDTDAPYATLADILNRALRIGGDSDDASE